VWQQAVACFLPHLIITVNAQLLPILQTLGLLLVPHASIPTDMPAVPFVMLLYWTSLLRNARQPFHDHVGVFFMDKRCGHDDFQLKVYLATLA
jgi:hypothetical protein